jgi:chromosome segregation ATPase
MQSNEIKVSSFRVSQEVKEHIQRLTEQRQLSTNQLFEQLITLADQQAPNPLIVEENAALEAALNQVLALFHERATRLESQQKEYERINVRYKNTVQDLEQSVILEAERLQEEYEQKVASHESELTQLRDQISQLITEKKIVEEALEAERISFKEELKEQKRTVFHLEGELKSFEQERSQLNRQNQSLMDMVDELKARTRRSDQLEEENQKLHLDVQLLRREKELFEDRLNEQIELAVLRERKKND